MEKKEFIIRLCNLLWRYFIKCCHELSLGSSRAIFLANDLWTTQITTSSSSSSICGRGDRGSGHLLPRRLSKPSSLYLQLFSAPSCHFLSRAVRRAARAVCVCVCVLGWGTWEKKRLKLALWSADSCRIPSAYRADSINSLTGTGWKKVVKKKSYPLRVSRVAHPMHKVFAGSQSFKVNCFKSRARAEESRERHIPLDLQANWRKNISSEAENDELRDWRMYRTKNQFLLTLQTSL